MNEYFTQLNHSKFNDKIYLLGTCERRITVYSQQIRATNLIYSLLKAEILKPDTNLAVVGCGVAGLTAAFSAAMLGCRKISLFEQGSNILGMWRSCHSRWIHPTLFLWPEEKWSQNQTDLPIFNWKGDIATNVAKILNHQYDFFTNYFNDKIELKINLESEARILENTSSISAGHKSNTENFDLIILAVGFGRDGKKNDESTSYWANDNIETIPDKKVNYFLSGNGDGGIADLFRIRLKEFNTDLLTKWVADPEVINILPEIRWIEDQALKLEAAGKDSNFIGNFYKDSYKKLKTPSINETIKNRLRVDTKVLFHGRSETMYDINAFPLNRFILSRIDEVDSSFEYKFGEIENLEELLETGLSRKETKVKIKEYEEETVDRVIIRHGPKSALIKEGFKWIYKNEVIKELRAKNTLDQTGVQIIYAIEDFKREYPGLIENLNRELNSNLGIKFKAMPFFSSKHERMLNSELNNQITLAQNELLFPNKEFKSEQDYLEGLMEILPHLEEGSTIRSVCGSKKWSSNWVIDYFKMNYEAIKRGVKIHRIFLLQEIDVDGLQRKAINEQKRNGVTISEVEFKKGKDLLDENNLPPTFGFAIIEQPGKNKEVIIHDLSNTSKVEFTGVKLTSPFLVKIYDDIWSSLYRESIDYLLKFQG